MAIHNLRAKIATPKTVSSPRIVQNDIRIDFPGGEKHTIVQRQDGVYAIVAPASGNVTIQSMTPAFRTVTYGPYDVDGQIYGPYNRKTNGAMVDPEFNSAANGQGFDQWVFSMSFDEGKRAEFPITLSVGQVLVCANSSPMDDVEPWKDQIERWGPVQSYATFQVVASAPLESSFAPASLTWPGKPADTSGYDIDVDAFVGSLPSYDTIGQNVPSFNEIYGRINRHAPVGFLQPNGNLSYRHYQTLLPYAFNGEPRTNANHGEFSSTTVNLACLALISDEFTHEEKVKIATALISHGIQWSDGVYANGTGYKPDGGHFQVMQGAAIVSRAARNLDLSDFIAKAGGNWNDCFSIVQADLDKLAPHYSSIDHPTFSRVREIESVDENNITVWLNQPGIFDQFDYYAFHFTGMNMVRVSDGATAKVISGFSRNGRGPTKQSINTVGGTIEGQPEGLPVFAPGNEIYFEPAHTIQLGDYDWQDKGATQGGNRNQWCPTGGQQYRKAQTWAGPVMLCAATGWLDNDPDFTKVLGYTYKAMSQNNPTPENDYPPINSSGWDVQFFARHGDAVFPSSAYEVIKTTTATPYLKTLRGGETVSSAFTSGAYDSRDGAIDTVTTTVKVNGSPQTLSYVTTSGDVVIVSETVTDVAGNTREFKTYERTVY